MKTFGFHFKNNSWTGCNDLPADAALCQFALVFGERMLLERTDINHEVKKYFPSANVVICSTSGEIYDNDVHDDSIVVTGLYFEHTALAYSVANINAFNNSYELGKHAAENLDKNGLSYVLLLSDGNLVNGTELTEAVKHALDNKVIVTGGLAGDAARFEKTIVGLNENIKEGNVVLVGFYGDRIKIGYGLKGGWEEFGPERRITAAEANVLTEIDNISALDLYKKYLGKYAEELPGSALLFPLSIKAKEDEVPVVRTILKINEAAKSMTFAGDMPVGARVRFMKADFEKLINSAGEAANKASVFSEMEPSLVLLISCVGRKLVLGERIKEEIASAVKFFPGAANITGFYSYGEISPQSALSCSDLHNQTMTITTFAEV